jgi:hypothetical protein
VRDIIQNVTTMIDRGINKIERIILKAKLKGKCEYLK